MRTSVNGRPPSWRNCRRRNLPPGRAVGVTPGLCHCHFGSHPTSAPFGTTRAASQTGIVVSTAAHSRASGGAVVESGGPAVNATTLWAVLKEAGSQWATDKAPRLGAALAYYAVFSIAPLLVIAIGVAGLVFGQEAARGQITGQVERPGRRAGRRGGRDDGREREPARDGGRRHRPRGRHAARRGGRPVRPAPGRPQHRLGGPAEARPRASGGSSATASCRSPWCSASPSCCSSRWSSAPPWRRSAALLGDWQTGAVGQVVTTVDRPGRHHRRCSPSSTASCRTPRSPGGTSGSGRRSPPPCSSLGKFLIGLYLGRAGVGVGLRGGRVAGGAAGVAVLRGPDLPVRGGADEGVRRTSSGPGSCRRRTPSR